jgi:shikimate kinase
MKRILLTGMSGTGKSTVIKALAARGYRAIDLDTDEWSEWVPVPGDTDPFDPPTGPDSVWHGKDWVWREDRVRQLLATEDADVLFISGTAPNQGKFRACLDHIILLSAPPEVLVERLSTRTTNPYGKHPEELARVLQHVQTVEPLLRRAATHEIDTSAPLEDVLEKILDLVQP